MVFVYGLYNPEKPDDIRYIGITTDLQQRLERSIRWYYTYFDGRNEKGKWMGELLKNNIRPSIKQLAKLNLTWEKNRSEILKIETRYIRYYRRRGHDLLNSREYCDLSVEEKLKTLIDNLKVRLSYYEEELGNS